MTLFSPLTLPVPAKQLRCEDDTPVCWLLSQYLLNEFQYALLHEPGILEDRDPEYLHQYRVSLRRCRSMLAIFAVVYPPQAVTKLRQQLKVMMEPSGLLRDLDVFTDPDSHPESLSTILSELLPVVTAKRSRVFQRFSHWIESDEYQHITQQIFTRFIDCAQHPTQAGLKSLHSVAAYHLEKQTRKLLKSSRRIKPGSTDEEIHKLRIGCKKLRYLNDFCRAVGITTAEQSLIEQAQLKHWQSELGKFNDTSSQLHFCLTHLSPLQTNTKTVQAVDAFVKHSREQHHASKQQVLNNIATLVKRGTKKAAH
ncbi:CHAD domain-containing protein [Vibrio ostreae]|uniref:CHAD domain-containing protein n=1 Tax=Vibrio ostreae TaxID=2841925 RepID=A0A975U8T6_9VIBR|nr:CHAD domain-containing protein [Vibrio ostreae]QXO16436.1 CHAD domain-containing protein [Vibrio ostreae]